ncbi:MAG: J domain-containing protein [Oscillochloridaceae bacterium umkhey_bin13]
MQDYYETLQVHPRADAEVIRAAYAQLRERYDPAKLDGVADELQELARQRRDAIERAFVVLSDPERRAQYDASLSERVSAAAVAAVPDDLDPDDLIDYRPLPPAKRQERPPGFNAQPLLTPAQARAGSGSGFVIRGRATKSNQPIWMIPALVVGIATFGVVLITLITTVLNNPSAVAPTGGPQSLGSSPTQGPSINEIASQFEGQIVAARQVAAQVPNNFNAWIELGNALYDSVVVVREWIGRDPAAQSLYVERLPRWLEAADAYQRAVDLDPTSPLARADLAASLCYYGQGVNDPSYVQRGVVEAEQALIYGPEDGRALLSAGICYALASPPRTAEALTHWQRLVVTPGAEANLVAQARMLIQEYSR